MKTLQFLTITALLALNACLLFLLIQRMERTERAAVQAQIDADLARRSAEAAEVSGIDVLEMTKASRR